MAKTDKDTIRDALLSAYDPDHFNSIYAQMKYAAGGKYEEAAAYTGSIADFPDWEDVKPQFGEVGTSRKIQQAQFLHLSKTMFAEPRPEWPQVDKWTAEIRKQVWLTCYREMEFGEELCKAFLDGDGYGNGFIKIEAKTNPRTGLQRASLRHSPILQTIVDPSVSNIGRARFCAFVDYIPLEEAIRLYAHKVKGGKETVKSHARPMRKNLMQHPAMVVRTIEYFDMGLGGGEPTRALLPSTLDQEPWEWGPNPYGSLPLPHYTHLQFPGWDKAVGRVLLQKCTQEQINEIERALRSTLKQVGFDIVDPTQLDADDMARLNAGGANVKVRLTNPKPGVPPFTRISAGEAARTLFEFYGMVDRIYTTESGLTDADKGILSEQKRTLGENLLLDERSQSQGNWTQLQAALMIRRVVEKWADCCARYHREPMAIDVFGHNVVIGEQEQPDYGMDEEDREVDDKTILMEDVWEEKSRVLIGIDSITVQDSKRDKAERIMELDALKGLVGPGVDIGWYTRKMLEAIDVEDIDEAMAKQPGMPGPDLGAMAGMPAPQGFPAQPGMAAA